METLANTNRVELIDEKKFAKVALDENFRIFVIHVTALEMMSIHPFIASRI